MTAAEKAEQHVAAGAHPVSHSFADRTDTLLHAGIHAHTDIRTNLQEYGERCLIYTSIYLLLCTLWSNLGKIIDFPLNAVVFWLAILTEYFIISEPKNMSIDEFYVTKNSGMYYL